MASGSLEILEILGVSIFDRPPIGTLHLPLRPGLHVLYGKNGAGKTRTLDAVLGALTNAEELESPVWVHLRVVYEALPGVLTTGANFREPLFFELSDSLLRSLHYGDFLHGESEMLEFMNDFGMLPTDQETDLPDSIEDLVSAIAWLEGIRGIAPAMREIRNRCYLSVETVAGRARVFLSSMNESTPILTGLGWMAVAMSRGSTGSDWDARLAREFLAPSQPIEINNGEIASTIAAELAGEMDAGIDDTNVIKNLLGAAAAMHPRFEFFHDARPHWVPAPLMALCGGIEEPILRVWEDRQEVDPAELAQRTLIAIGIAEDESSFKETGKESAIGIEATPKVNARLAQLGSLASYRFEALLKDAPPIEPVLLSPNNWLHGRVVEWTAYDLATAQLHPVELGKLSEAQRRWAAASIRQTLDSPSTQTHLIMDEPERGLRTTATTHLAQGLAEMANAAGLLVLVASHAPGMLSYPGATLLHVHRDDVGELQISGLSPSQNSRLIDTAEGLGLTTSDLLQLTRVFLYVEGEHDKAVLRELFSSDFDSAGVRVLTLGGARNLATVTDSRFIFDYTDADVMVVVDNVDGPVIREAWKLAKQEAAAGRKNEAYRTLDRTQGSGAEWEYLRVFAKAAIDHGHVDRLHIYGLSKPDLIYYLPADHFVAGSSWEELTSVYLRERIQIKNAMESIKHWLKRRHSVTVTTKRMANAARLVDEPHEDLWGVMRYATSLALLKRNNHL